MLRGLLYRKLFATLETVLGVVIAVIIGLILFEMVMGAPVDGVASVSPGMTTDSNVGIPTSQPLSEYAILTDSGIFGPAASFNRESAPPEPVEAHSETTLPLTLKGTVLAGLMDPLKTAIIEVREGQAKEGAFYEGDSVVSQVMLKEIRSMEVILENRRKNPPVLERLTQAKVDGSAGPRISARQVVARRPVRGRSVLKFKRDEAVKRLEDNLAALQSKLDVKVSRDKNGRVQGVTATNISEFPELVELAAEFGFQEGDILSSVNGEPIDSQEKVYEIAEKFRDQTTFNVTIIRGGKRIALIYRFE